MKFGPVVQEIAFKEKFRVDDGQITITIAYLEHSAQVS